MLSLMCVFFLAHPLGPCDEWVFQAASGVSSSYDALLDLFDYLGSFLKRLEIYTNIPPTPIMIDLIVKIMAKILEVLALATKQIKRGRFGMCPTTYPLPVDWMWHSEIRKEIVGGERG